MHPDQADVLEAIRTSIFELDGMIGPRRSAMVVSGSMVPPFRGVSTNEAPQYATFRVMVAPILGTLGFSDVTLDTGCMCRLPNLAVSIAAANCPMSEPVCNLLDTMRRSGIGRGFATDGIRWAQGRSDGRRVRITHVVDLSPYFIEVLDRMRFRESVEADRTELSLFVETFSKDADG